MIIDLAAREEMQRSGTALGLELEWSPKGIPGFWKRWLQSKSKKARLAINIGLGTREPAFQLAAEKAFGRTLHMPMTMVCAYSSKEAAEQNGQIFTGLLKTHGHAIFPGIALSLLV